MKIKDNFLRKLSKFNCLAINKIWNFNITAFVKYVVKWSFFVYYNIRIYNIHSKFPRNPEFSASFRFIIHSYENLEIVVKTEYLIFSPNP